MLVTRMLGIFGCELALTLQNTMKTAAFLIASLLTSLPAAFAGTATIPPDADTTIDENFPANNFGARASLRAGAGATGRTRALVSFNVAAAVPPGATILAARLAGPELDALATRLKKLCGAGGTVRDGVIEVQTDQRPRIQVELEKLGYRVKIAGG